MFSEYKSKFLSQSQAPLFDSQASFYQDPASSPRPGSSSKTWASSFASRKKPLEYASDHEEDEDEEEETAAFLGAAQPLQHSASSVVGGEVDREVDPKMHSVDLESDTEPPPDIAIERDPDSTPRPNVHSVSPVPVALKNPGGPGGGPVGHGDHVDVSHEMTSSYIPPELPIASPDSPVFDRLWGGLYLAAVSGVLSTSVLLWLGTDGSPIGGDSIYTTIKGCASTLVLSAVVATLLSVAWVFVMRKYAVSLIYASIVSVPVVLVSLWIYPLVMSYRTGDGFSPQDRAMRWTSLIPLVLAAAWVAIVYKGRHSLARALGIVQLACTILSDHKPLIGLGMATVVVFLFITWVWTNMFAAVFQFHGHPYVLGALYILVYLWTWGVISGIQRATVAATVSQWYFHRHEFPHGSSMVIVKAGLSYAVMIQFGSICLSSLLCLLAWLPILILPRRLVGWIKLVVYNIIAASIVSLTNPLTLTNAIINSQSLMDSARTVASLRHLELSMERGDGWLSYRLSKMLLSTARGLTCLFMGFVAWVHAARDDSGSLYGYIVGLIAGFIGWFVLGATEGTLSMVVDSAFVCFALDNASTGGHCAEADRQFGGLD